MARRGCVLALRAAGVSGCPVESAARWGLAGAAVGPAATSWGLPLLLLYRLHRVAGGGRVLLPGVPHRYALVRDWPGSCWCSRPKGDPVHRSSGGVPL
jgi:hypothetical protein